MKTRHAAVVVSVAALALPVLVASPVAEHGQTFDLQRFSSGAWHTVAHLALGSTSAATFAEKLTAIGTYKFRGLFPGTSLNAAGMSATLTVKAT